MTNLKITYSKYQKKKMHFNSIIIVIVVDPHWQQHEWIGSIGELPLFYRISAWKHSSILLLSFIR